MVTASLTLIFVAGHPIIAIWVALIIVGWLFIAGAAIASEIDAAEIRMRAERRLAECIRARRETAALNPGGWKNAKHKLTLPSFSVPQG